MLCERSLYRYAHGSTLSNHQTVQNWIADSEAEMQAARLMTLHAAEKVDAQDPEVRTIISAIKVFVPAAYHRVVDRAIQVFGAAGIANDFPLAGMYLSARSLRLADGPDEVHKILIAKSVMRRRDAGEGWDFGS